MNKCCIVLHRCCNRCACNVARATPDKRAKYLNMTMVRAMVEVLRVACATVQQCATPNTMQYIVQ